MVSASYRSNMCVSFLLINVFFNKIVCRFFLFESCFVLGDSCFNPFSSFGLLLACFFNRCCFVSCFWFGFIASEKERENFYAQFTRKTILRTFLFEMYVNGKGMSSPLNRALKAPTEKIALDTWKQRP